MKAVVAAGVVLAGLIFAQIAAAQALRPEAVPEDRSTPRGTLKVLRTALEKGDADQIRSILAAGNPSEQAMVDVMAQTAVSVKRLHDAAVEAFGADNARAITGEPAARSPDGLTDLDHATESIAEDGQSATVTFQDVDTRPIRLTRNQDQWRIPVSELKQLDPAALEARMAEVKALNALVDEVAAEVAQGKYKSAEEARQALYNRLIQNASATQSTATAPASTQPATPAGN